MDTYADLIGRTVHVLNADSDFLNLVDAATGRSYWVESTGRLLVFASEPKEYDREVPCIVEERSEIV